MEDVVLNPGQIICDGRYEIVNRIGLGGMGVVYKAKALTLKRNVAIKMLTHSTDDLLARFKREAQLLAQIDHPAVIKIYDIQLATKFGPILVMEYAEGQDLSDCLGEPFAVAEAVQVVLSVCAGVNACHRWEIIHRDLKPNNIRLNKAGGYLDRVKILDFGLAIPFGSDVHRSIQARVTQVGTIVGTPGFVAPEILRGEIPSKSCDQYGIGTLLYAVLTGRAPFANLQDQDLIQAILEGAYINPRLFRPDIPPPLEAVIARALHPDPLQRFSDVSTLAFELVPFVSSGENIRWTKYFTIASRPVPRKYLQSVSASNECDLSVPLVKRAIVEHRPSPMSLLAPKPEPVARHVQPPVYVPPRKPSRVPRREHLQPKRKQILNRQILLAFILGAVFGIATTVVVHFFYSDRSPPIKERPTATSQHIPASP